MTRRATAALALLLPMFAVDGQATWARLTSGTTASLRGLNVVSDQIVWASGTKGTVLRTLDGGMNWRADTIPGASKLDIRAVHARSATIAHAAATAGRIWRTTDGGHTWSLRYQASDTAVFLDAISFWDDQHGMALGDPRDGRFFILTTADGGDTWREAPADSRPVTLDGEAAFAASGSSLLLLPTGIALIGSGGKAARVHRSADGGKTWTVVDLPIQSGSGTNGIFSLAFKSATVGIAVGGDYRTPDSTRASAAVTRDGGTTWSAASGMPSGYRSGAALSDRSLALAVGTNGSDVSYDSGTTWTPFDKAGFNSVQISPGGTAFAVGDRGVVARLDTRSLTKK